MDITNEPGEGPQFVGHMTVAPNDWLLGIQKEIDGHLATMRVVLRLIESGNYQATLNSRGNPNLVLFQVNDADSQRATEQAIFDAFQAIMRSYSKYLDALIALNKLKKGFVVDRDLSGEEQITSYVLERIETEAHEVAADRKRHLPVKVREIGDLPEWLLNIVDGYVALRNAIEHHHRRLRQDVSFIVHRVAVTNRDGQETVRLGSHLEKDDHIGVAWLKHEIPLAAGTRLQFSEEIVELVAFTLENRVCPVLYEAIANPGTMADLPEFPTIDVNFILTEPE